MTAQPPVAIVGLGPVGATAALLLARYGVATVVFERRLQAQPLTRAVTIDDEALRVLHDAGLGGEIALPPMLTDQPVRFRSREGAVLLQLEPRVTPYGHPAIAFLHQDELEASLTSAVERSSLVTVERGQEVVGLTHEGSGVALSLRATVARGGPERRFRVAYVLACDGSRSALRAALGVSLRGFTARRRWLAIDAGGGGSRAGEPGFEFVCDPARPAANGPLPGGHHRFEFMLSPGEPADDRAVARLLEPWGGRGGIDVLRWAIYPQHARVASRWRVGRALLLGDAAHLSPTFAGQGLSSGLRDAANVAWKLAALLAGSAAPALLDSYELERRPHAVRMNALAVALGRAVELRRMARARDRLLASPALARLAASGGWKPVPRYRRGLVGRDGGALLSQPEVRAGISLDEAIGPRLGVVGFGVDPSGALDAATRALLDHLGARIVLAERQAAPAGLPACASIALVRPDRFVFARVAPGDLRDAIRDLAAALRAPPASGGAR